MLKSADWYEKAVLSIKISEKEATNFIEAYANVKK